MKHSGNNTEDTKTKGKEYNNIVGEGKTEGNTKDRGGKEKGKAEIAEGRKDKTTQ